MQTRRDALKRSATVAGLLGITGSFPQYAFAAWNKTAFDAKTVAQALAAITPGRPVESRDVVLQAPDISENGAVVPLSAATSLPGVRQMLLLVEKNPAPLVASFAVTDALEANFSIRAKMAQSSDVYAVAIMADGRALFARREVKVTLGGCGA